jgi:hypothetical protein
MSEDKNKTHTIANLSAVSRDGKNYYAIYEYDEESDHYFTVPVFTGNVKPNGRPAVSSRTAGLCKANKTERRRERVEIKRSEAETLYDAAVATLMVERLEKLTYDENEKKWTGWVAWIRGS